MEINERRVLQQVRNFERALTGFDRNEPLARYLTRFFKENKQMGSSDRRMTSRFCYNFFRLGNAFPQDNIVERLIVAEFLCEDKSDFVALKNDSLNEAIHLPVQEKLAIATKLDGFEKNKLFPLLDKLSDGVEQEAFLASHFVQPDLFIRLCRGQEAKVLGLLERNEVKFNRIGPQTVALPNGTKLQHIKGLAGLYEVQDLSSQSTADFLDASPNEQWWDACAASGGKALMLLDQVPSTKLLVSDIRLSILRNLDERFLQAGIKQHYRKKIIDLTSAENTKAMLGEEQFDGIILDAPCSGSGTWGRTPEMMQAFDEEKLVHFTELQKKIATQVYPFLKKGKPLLYITCSVYKAENEDMVNYLVKELSMKLEKMSLINGYTNKSDSMFAARLIKL